MWASSRLTEELAAAVLVVISKKGDMANRDNYRGISLYDNLAKVLMTVLGRRLTGALSKEGRLSPAQAGFVPREEAPAQLVALRDICTRRRTAGAPTYLIFVDIKKAYDSCPQGALLWRLWQKGVRGKFFEFMASLYGQQTIRVRGEGGHLSDPITLQRGTGQGNPLSCPVFDAFIDTLIQEVPGVAVPGLDVAALIRGLLFADDAVLLCASLADARLALASVGEWAGVHGLEFGLPKCGILLCGGDEAALTELAEAGLELQGGKIPVVDRYTYLGGEFHGSLDMGPMVAARAEATRRAAAGLYPLLSNVRIPVAVNQAALRTFLQPVAMSGGELLGMEGVGTVGPIQRQMNNAMARVAFGKRGGPRPSPAFLMLFFFFFFFCKMVLLDVMSRDEVSRLISIR
jgi:hypothetical protein